MNTTIDMHLTLIEQSEPDKRGVITYTFSVTWEETA